MLIARHVCLIMWYTTAVEQVAINNVKTGIVTVYNGILSTESSINRLIRQAPPPCIDTRVSCGHIQAGLLSNGVLQHNKHLTSETLYQVRVVDSKTTMSRQSLLPWCALIRESAATPLHTCMGRAGIRPPMRLNDQINEPIP